MAWNATRTPRNTLHVIDSVTGSHFEAADEDEARETIEAHLAALDEQKRAKEESEKQTADFVESQGDAPTLRVN